MDELRLKTPVSRALEIATHAFFEKPSISANPDKIAIKVRESLS
jgi:hypothetical protein